MRSLAMRVPSASARNILYVARLLLVRKDAVADVRARVGRVLLDATDEDGLVIDGRVLLDVVVVEVRVVEAGLGALDVVLGDVLNETPCSLRRCFFFLVLAPEA